jgi:preprotein translocase subunit YajC
MQQYFPIILIVLAVLLLFVLPSRQRKRVAAQAQTLQASLQPGTPVLTTSGIHGDVVRLGDKTIDLEIAAGVVVTFERRAVLQVRQPVVAPEAAPGMGTTELGSTGDDAPGTADGPADRAH